MVEEKIKLKNMEKLDQNFLEKEMESETSEMLDFDFEKSENFIEQNFSRTEKEVEFEGLKYKLIEFCPKNKEVKEWILDRKFYLFGGSGNMSRSVGNTAEVEENKKEHLEDIKEKYSKEWVSDCQKMSNLLENNYEEVVVKTEEAIGLIEGFLKSMNKDSLASYYTSSLYGEHKAFVMKDLMEKGEDMEKITAERLNSINEGLWVNSQLSPYTPYVSVEFLRKDINQMEGWKIIFEKAYDKLQEQQNKNVHIKFNKLNYDKISELITKEIESGNEFLKRLFPMDIWRDLHSLIYAKHSDVYRPVRVEFDNLFNQEFSNHIEDNRYAFSLMSKDKNFYSGSAGDGWSIPASDDKISDMTDFTMITGKEFHQDGVFKFMMIEHNENKT